MSRFDISDFEWQVIEPLLPNKSRGVSRGDGRRVLNGIFSNFEAYHGVIYRPDAPVRKILLQGLQPHQVVIADRAYDADWIRALIYEQGAIDYIPSKSNRICPKPFDKEQYKQRHKIECFFGRMKKSFRSIATRYDKYATSFMAMIKIAAIRLWCEFYESAT